MLKNNFLYYNPQHLDYVQHVDLVLERRKKEILDFFNETKEIKFNVYLYDTIEELREKLTERGFKDIPSYMSACMKDEDNSINLFIPKENPSQTEWNREEYDTAIFHESVHFVQFNIFGQQPEWLTEGVAKVLDKEYEGQEKQLIEEVNGYKIPKIEELSGKTFCTDFYNGEKLSYLMIKYLLETIGREKFLKVISKKELLEEVSKELLPKSIEYFNKKYDIKGLENRNKNPAETKDLISFASKEYAEKSKISEENKKRI